MKSSSDGPSDSVVAKVVFFNAVGLDVAGVAKERICLVTEARTRHEWVRMRDIVSRRELGANAFPKQDLAHRVRCHGPLSLSPPSMSTLSRREEDTLFKATKANALRECDGLVKGTFVVTCPIPGSHPPPKAFAECAAGRTVSVAWACREKFKDVQDCVYQLYVSCSIHTLCWFMFFQYTTREHAACAGRISPTAQ